MKSLNPNNLGLLVEDCRKIRLSDFIGKYKDSFKETLIKSELSIQGLDIELTTSRTNFNGLRFWFKCPLCQKRVGVLYEHPINSLVGCRKCLNLEYKSRRFKGMIEGEIVAK